MLRRTVAGKIDRMGRVVKPKTLKRALDTNTILEIYPVLLSYDQGSSHTQQAKVRNQL